MMELLSPNMQKSVQEMRIHYPALMLDSRSVILNGEVAWNGWIQPIYNLENLEWILADLDQDRRVRILQDGQIVHDPNCNRNHQHLPWIKNLKRPDQAFKVKITYSGGKKHPRCYVLEPDIPKSKRKHMFGDGAICAYSPQKNLWSAEIHTVVEFTDYAAIWLFKWNVWNQTGNWLGKETSHNKIALYNSIDSSAQCWCGSGDKYSECHRIQDKFEIDKELLRFLQKNSIAKRF